eukprot:5084781-Pyramimonas_sp.AAC.1
MPAGSRHDRSATCFPALARAFARLQEALRPQVFEWAERIGISHADTDGMIMCGLWGDGAPYHTRDSLCMFTITALTGTCRAADIECAQPAPTTPPTHSRPPQ